MPHEEKSGSGPGKVGLNAPLDVVLSGHCECLKISREVPLDLKSRSRERDHEPSVSRWSGANIATRWCSSAVDPDAAFSETRSCKDRASEMALLGVEKNDRIDGLLLALDPDRSRQSSRVVSLLGGAVAQRNLASSRKSSS